MKRLLFTLLITILVVGRSFAAHPFQMGIKGGISSIKSEFKDTEIGNAIISHGEIPQVGYNFGLVTDLQLGFFSLQAELIYNLLNYSYMVKNPAYSQKTIITERRLDAPVLFGINISRLRLFGGPVFILSRSAEPVSSYIPIDLTTSKKDIDLQVGASIDLNKAFIDLRYSKPWDKKTHHVTYGSDSGDISLTSEHIWSCNIGFFF